MALVIRVTGTLVTVLSELSCSLCYKLDSQFSCVGVVGEGSELVASDLFEFVCLFVCLFVGLLVSLFVTLT